MKKLVLFALIALVAVLGGATAMLYSKYQKTSTDYATLQADEQATRNRYGQAINEIAAIQDSLNAIALGDEGARALSMQLDAEQRLSQTRGDEAMQRIAVIKAGIERTKARITELDQKLKQSGIRAAGLQRMVTNLREAVADREVMVAQLSNRVDALQTQVTGLSAEVEDNHQTIQTQATTIETKRRELGTIFYTIGTRRELTDAGLVEAKGGLLGLGRTIEPTGTVNEAYFTALDTDAETVIRIPATKAQVISDQPPSSYMLQSVGDQVELHILNPQAFRSVKHLVILTT